MSLEAVMICVDNSDYTRNGDYTPTRFESQTDAVNLVCGAKTQANAENSVGILTTAGDRIDVKITPTTELGKIISELPAIQIGGSSDLMRGIQTAQLALKHRQNKNQRQRIIAFIGSPVRATEKELETLGKNLKKNNVSLDLVSFGEVEENTSKLEKLLNAANSNDTSHLVEVPIGPKLLSDVLLGSSVIGGGGMSAAEGGGAADEFGINPNEDPELALALRISMEEERARQQAANGGGDAAPAAGGDAPAGQTQPASAENVPAGQSAMPTATDAAVLEAMNGEDMDEELRQALLLSMQDANPADASSAAPAPAAPAAPTAPVATVPAAAPQSAPVPAPAASDLMEGLPDDMDEELRKALELSMVEADPPAPAPADSGTASTTAAAAPSQAAADKDTAAATADDSKIEANWFQDPSFVKELLGSLPGVDINDPRIQTALKEVSEGEKKEEGTDDKKGEGSGSSDAQRK